jgi:hypothetical protein
MPLANDLDGLKAVIGSDDGVAVGPLQHPLEHATHIYLVIDD